MIYVSEGCSISIRVSRLWFRLQPVPFKRINSIAISHSRSNSGSDGIFSRDSGRSRALPKKMACNGIRLCTRVMNSPSRVQVKLSGIVDALNSDRFYRLAIWRRYKTPRGLRRGRAILSRAFPSPTSFPSRHEPRAGQSVLPDRRAPLRNRGARHDAG